MKKLIDNIDKQIEFNRGKNLFSDKANLTFQFIQDTIQSINTIDNLDPILEILLIDYSTEKSLKEICRTNQYYHFNSEAKANLRDIYVDLFKKIKEKNISVEQIAQQHYENLKNWLRNTNAFAEKIYQPNIDIVENVTCSEYSPLIQIEILKIDLESLLQPVLDIGCGEQGNFVRHITSKGKECYGIDRFAKNADKLIPADWLEYNYGIEKWGTIISNLGFSNHFIHHHLRSDGDFIAYAKKYMEILNSLKIGGSFHYAPSMSFIEQYLETNKFNVINYSTNISNFESTIITKLQ